MKREDILPLLGFGMWVIAALLFWYSLTVAENPLNMTNDQDYGTYVKAQISAFFAGAIGLGLMLGGSNSE